MWKAKCILQTLGIHRLDQCHLHFTPLGISILFHRDADGNLVKDRYRNIFAFRTRYCYAIRIRVKLSLLLERDETLDAQPGSRGQITRQLQKKENDILANEDTQAVSEGSNDEGLFLDLTGFSLLRLGFQGKTNVKLNASTSCHLGHSMSVIDVIHYTFDK